MGNSTCANLLMDKGMTAPATKFAEMKLQGWDRNGIQPMTTSRDTTVMAEIWVHSTDEINQPQT